MADAASPSSERLHELRIEIVTGRCFPRQAARQYRFQAHCKFNDCEQSTRAVQEPAAHSSLVSFNSTLLWHLTAVRYHALCGLQQPLANVHAD